MSEKDQFVSASHDYDGIQEYDNPAPSWWNYLFYLTIIYSAWYIGYYSGMDAALTPVVKGEEVTAWSVARYNLKMKRTEADLAKIQQKPLEGEELLAFLKAPGAVQKGRAIYEANCVACHSEKGQGLVGPNLVDDFWVHGWKAEDIIQSIAKGFPDKGMEAWDTKIGMRKIYQVTAYIQSIEGIEVPNPKAPEGEKK